MDDARQLDGPRFEIDIASEEYPAILRDTPDPPRVLRGIGNPAALRPGIAIIGSRKATPYGLACAEAFASHIASRGHSHHLRWRDGMRPVCAPHGARCRLPDGRRLWLGCRRDLSQARPRTVPTCHRCPRCCHLRKSLGYPARCVRPSCDAIASSRDLRHLCSSWRLASRAGPSRRRMRLCAPTGDVAAVPGSITSPNSRGTNHLIAQGAIASSIPRPSIPRSSLPGPIPCTSCFPIGSRRGRGMHAMTSSATIPSCAHLPPRRFPPSSSRPTSTSLPASFRDALASYELDNLVQRGMDGRYQLVPRRQGRRDRHM